VRTVCRALSQGILALMIVTPRVPPLIQSLSNNFDMPLISSLSMPPHCSTCPLTDTNGIAAAQHAFGTTMTTSFGVPDVLMPLAPPLSTTMTATTTTSTTTLHLLPELTPVIVDVMFAYEWLNAYYIYDTTDGWLISFPRLFEDLKRV